MVLGLALLGYVLDLATGVTRPPRMSLLLGVGLAFFGWAMLTIAISAPEIDQTRARSTSWRRPRCS